MNRMKGFGAMQAADGLNRAVVYDANGRPIALKVFYVYTVDIAALSEGTSGSGSFTVQADSDFLIQQLTGVALLAANTYIADPGPVATLQITDTGSAFNLFSAPAYWANVIGTAQFPFILPIPRMLSANAKVNVTIDLIEEGASDNHFQINFIGHKLYKIGG